jgi:hypothetical protein
VPSTEARRANNREAMFALGSHASLPKSPCRRLPWLCSGEALFRTRTGDPFLTMGGQGVREPTQTAELRQARAGSDAAQVATTSAASSRTVRTASTRRHG